MTSLLCLDHNFPALREGQWMELRPSQPQAALGGRGRARQSSGPGTAPSCGCVWLLSPHPLLLPSLENTGNQAGSHIDHSACPIPFLILSKAHGSQ